MWPSLRMAEWPWKGLLIVPDLLAVTRQFSLALFTRILSLLPALKSHVLPPSKHR